MTNALPKDTSLDRDSAKLPTSVEYQFEKTHQGLEKYLDLWNSPWFLNTWAARRGSHTCKVSLADTQGNPLQCDPEPCPWSAQHSPQAKLHQNFQDCGKFSYLCLQTQGHRNPINLIHMLLGKSARREEAPRATTKQGITPGQGPEGEEQHIHYHRDWAPFSLCSNQTRAKERAGDRTGFKII